MKNRVVVVKLVSASLFPTSLLKLRAISLSLFSAFSILFLGKLAMSSPYFSIVKNSDYLRDFHKGDE